MEAMPLRTRWFFAGLLVLATVFVFMLGYVAGATSTIVRWASDPPTQPSIDTANVVSGPFYSPPPQK